MILDVVLLCFWGWSQGESRVVWGWYKGIYEVVIEGEYEDIWGIYEYGPKVDMRLSQADPRENYNKNMQ
jgi:hypothetical protein